jgi:hypothetical protein
MRFTVPIAQFLRVVCRGRKTVAKAAAAADVCGDHRMPTEVPTVSLRPTLILAALVLAAAECPAIEMFTYFGDGSRIGLPSLEVPVEAYPGIPLRSDRIRARRRGMRQAATARTRTGMPGTITLREAPAPVLRPDPAPATVPVAPEPE